jgi:hypothetical protein
MLQARRKSIRQNLAFLVIGLLLLFDGIIDGYDEQGYPPVMFSFPG